MKVYGLIPAYNEEENIAEVVKRTKEAGIMPVVVDDASEDKTAEYARDAGAKVAKHATNRGKGEAIKNGLKILEKNFSDDDFVVVIDADLQYSPGEAVKLLSPLKSGEADFVTGHRNFSEVPYFRHRLGNFVWRNAFNILFGTKFKDTSCGFIAMNKKAAKIMRENVYGGYILESAMFIHALKNGLRIRQVPVSVNYREKSKIKRGIRVVAGVSLFILKEGLKNRFGRK